VGIHIDINIGIVKSFDRVISLWS